MPDNAIRAHLAVVSKLDFKKQPGMIFVSLFPSEKPENGGMWVPFLYHADIYGYGFHSVPRVGDTVLVLGYGESNDTYVAVANFWSIGQSPFNVDIKNKEYQLDYFQINPDVIDEGKLSSKSTSAEVNDVIKLVKKSDKADDKQALVSPKNLIFDGPDKDPSKVYSLKTLHYQGVVNELDENDSTAVFSSREGDSVIMMSNSGISIYDKNHVNIYSENDIHLASGEKINIVANQFNVNVSEAVNISSKTTNIISEETVDIHGKTIYLNTEKSKPVQNGGENPTLDPSQNDEGQFYLAMNVKLPWANEELTFGDYNKINNGTDFICMSNFDDNSYGCSFDNPGQLGLKYDQKKSGGSGQNIEKDGKGAGIYYGFFIKTLRVKARNEQDKKSHKPIKIFEVDLEIGVPNMQYAVPFVPMEDPETGKSKVGDDVPKYITLSQKVNHKTPPLASLFLEGEPHVCIDFEHGCLTHCIPLNLKPIKLNLYNGDTDIKQNLISVTVSGDEIAALWQAKNDCKAIGYTKHCFGK